MRRFEPWRRGGARRLGAWLFAAHGWGGWWVASVFDFHHFHSTSHEALAVVGGSATLELSAARERIAALAPPPEDPIGGGRAWRAGAPPVRARGRTAPPSRRRPRR